MRVAGEVGSASKMASEANVDLALNDILPQFSVSEMKKQQKEILMALVEKRDCIATLPTGFGKSLPFQVYIPVQRAMKKQTGRVIVCCPLTALMRDQVSKLKDISGITAAYKGSSDASDKNIIEGCIDVIYASPESLVGDADFRKALAKLDVDVIVIDEFHTIATWGQSADGTEKNAFRKWFSYIGELRSLFPSACVLALSATCTLKIKKRVTKVLCLKDNVVDINISPNKTNIKLSVSKIPNHVDSAMSWLVDGLTESKEDFPRTIIYCHSIKDVTKIYTYIVDEMSNDTNYIQMFHSETTAAMKEEILNTLQDPTSELKVIVCTNALGMGVDIVDFQSVIIYGPPQNVVDLVQEIGRVGRNGNPSVALLLHNSYHLKLVDTDVKNVFKDKECRRLALMKAFLSSHALDKMNHESAKHTCCDLCAIVCACKNCSMLKLEAMYVGQIPSLESDSSVESDETELYYYSEDDDL